MIIHNNAVLRRPFAETSKAQGPNATGRFATLNSDGKTINLITASDTEPDGIIANPDGELALQAGGTCSADIILTSFGGIVQAQVGNNPGSINAGTKLSIDATGCVIAAPTAAGTRIVGKATQKLPTSTAGQLIDIILLNPYKL